MSISRTLLAVFAVLLAVITSIGYLTRRSHVDSLRAATWVVHTHVVLTEIDNIRAALNEAVADQRSFLVAGNDAFLTGFDTARSDLPQSIDTLASLTQDNPAQQARIVSLRGAARQAFASLQHTIDVLRDDGLPAASAVVRQGTSQARVGQVRHVLGDMKNAELRLLDVRMAAAQADARAAARWLAALGVAVGLLLVLAYLLVIREFSRRKQITRELVLSEQRFRLMVESVSDYALFMLDPEGIVRSWNPGAQRLLGYTSNEVIGRHFSMFYTPENVKLGRCVQALQAAAAEGRFTEDGLRTRKDGSSFFAHVVISAIHAPDGALLGFAKVTQDLTEIRKAEEERIRLARATEGVRLRDEFFAIVSHELRTPLTPLQLELQRFARGLERGADVHPAAVERALRQVIRLRRLVEGLLDTARIREDQLQLHVEEVDLVPLAAQVLDEFRPVSDQTLGLSGDSSVVVRGDRVRLERVLVSLVHNAMKYSPPEGRIQVSVTGAGGQARVSVSDEGVGIPKEEQTQVFQRFFRAGNVTSRNFGGLGLGLYLSYEIVRRLGGAFDLQSEPGRGSIFTFRLPLAHEAMSAGAALGSDAQQIH